MKIVFVASIIRNKLCMIYAFLIICFKNHFLMKIIFLTAEINLTTWGPPYTCLVSVCFHWSPAVILTTLYFLALGTYAQEGSAFGAQKPTVGLQQSAVTQLPAGSHATQLSGSEVIYAAGNALSASAGDASQVLNYQSVDAQQLSRSSASSRGFHPYGR